MRHKFAIYGLIVCAVGGGAWLLHRTGSKPTTDASARAVKDERARIRLGRAAVSTPDATTPAAVEAEPGLSKYQLAFAGPSLDVLAKLERTANESHDAVLLARVFVERSRVLHAAAGLPPIEPNGQKGRSDP